MYNHYSFWQVISLVVAGMDSSVGAVFTVAAYFYGLTNTKMVESVFEISPGKLMVTDIAIV